MWLTFYVGLLPIAASLKGYRLISMAGSNYDLSKYYPQATFGPGVQVMGIRNVTIGRGAASVRMYGAM